MRIKVIIFQSDLPYFVADFNSKLILYRNRYIFLKGDEEFEVGTNMFNDNIQLFFTIVLGNIQICMMDYIGFFLEHVFVL